MPLLPRRTILTVAALSVASCNLDRDNPGEDASDGAPQVELRNFDTTVLPLDAAPEQVSQTILAAAPAVFVATPSRVDEAAEAATNAGVPLLLEAPGLLGELDRLGTRSVLALEGDEPEVGDRELLKDPAKLDASAKPQSNAVAIHLADAEPHAATRAMLNAAGIELHPLSHEDPRATSDSVAVVRDATSVLALGDFGDEERFASRVAMAQVASEIPGGGVAPYPDKLMIALYGHPSGGTLGLLGEQGPAESVDRVKELAAQYEPLTSKQVVPAFEIITTVASASAGKDQDYSYETPAEELLPLIDAAEEAGIYCVLDLQPGHTDFLTQAKLYEDLLLKPHVGLALDPEWRLKPGWRHMKQIGQVEIDEVNATGQWLADLVKDNNLPAKILILHQFQTRMIVDRDQLDTSRDEIQYLVHVDGNGSHGAKLSTWNTLKDVPEGAFLGWKNFIDEDSPMMTPQETMELVEPTPDFVSYQ